MNKVGRFLFSAVNMYTFVPKLESEKKRALDHKEITESFALFFFETSAITKDVSKMFHRSFCLSVCTASKRVIFFLKYRDQACLQYSRCGFASLDDLRVILLLTFLFIE